LRASEGCNRLCGKKTVGKKGEKHAREKRKSSQKTIGKVIFRALLWVARMPPFVTAKLVSAAVKKNSRKGRREEPEVEKGGQKRRVKVRNSEALSARQAEQRSE